LFNREIEDAMVVPPVSPRIKLFSSNSGYMLGLLVIIVNIIFVGSNNIFIMNTLENFIKGSSLVAAFPTLLYVGVFQMKNRQALLQKASSLELQNFLSIPFESIVVGVLVSYGIAFTIMKRNIDEEKDSKLKKLVNFILYSVIFLNIYFIKSNIKEPKEVQK